MKIRQCPYQIQDSNRYSSLNNNDVVGMSDLKPSTSTEIDTSIIGQTENLSGR